MELNKMTWYTRKNKNIILLPVGLTYSAVYSITIKGKIKRNTVCHLLDNVSNHNRKTVEQVHVMNVHTEHFDHDFVVAIPQRENLQHSLQILYLLGELDEFN